jgi:hypothetical protein
MHDCGTGQASADSIERKMRDLLLASCFVPMKLEFARGEILYYLTDGRMEGHFLTDRDESHESVSNLREQQAKKVRVHLHRIFLILLYYGQ